MELRLFTAILGFAILFLSIVDMFTGFNFIDLGIFILTAGLLAINYVTRFKDWFKKRLR